MSNFSETNLAKKLTDLKGFDTVNSDLYYQIVCFVINYFSFIGIS